MKYTVVYWSTYDYKWHVYSWERSKRKARIALSCLKRTNKDANGRWIDGDPEQYDAQIMEKMK